MKIAFIGLGNMGAPMACNLLEADHVLSVLDLSAQAVGTLMGVGAVAAVSPKDAATGVKTVITMPPAAAYVHRVLTAENSVLVGITKSVPIIDSSTINPASAKAFGAIATGHGDPFVNTLISGGIGDAAAGTLTSMVGGSAATFEQVHPVLFAMGKNLVYCGDTGAGQDAKICNNLVLDITMADVAEAMSLEETLSVDLKVLDGIINTSAGHCWDSDTYNPFPGVIDTAPSPRGCTGGFGTDLMLKDLGLVGDAAKSVRQPVYFGASARQLYQTVSSKGDGRLDFSAVIRLYRKNGAA